MQSIILYRVDRTEMDCPTVSTYHKGYEEAKAAFEEAKREFLDSDYYKDLHAAYLEFKNENREMFEYDDEDDVRITENENRFYFFHDFEGYGDYEISIHKLTV